MEFAYLDLSTPELYELTNHLPCLKRKERQFYEKWYYYKGNLGVYHICLSLYSLMNLLSNHYSLKAPYQKWRQTLRMLEAVRELWSWPVCGPGSLSMFRETSPRQLVDLEECLHAQESFTRLPFIHGHQLCFPGHYLEAPLY